MRRNKHVQFSYLAIRKQCNSRFGYSHIQFVVSREAEEATLCSPQSIGSSQNKKVGIDKIIPNFQHFSKLGKVFLKQFYFPGRTWLHLFLNNFACKIVVESVTLLLLLSSAFQVLSAPYLYSTPTQLQVCIHHQTTSHATFLRPVALDHCVPHI